MNKEELLNINGGASINGSLLNALVRVGTLLFEFGRSLGSSIRRTRSGSYC